MSNNKELLSSFIDEQSLSKQQLEALLLDEQTSGDFERYHLIGDALRDELSPHYSVDFADNLSAAIALEPTVLAPKSERVTTLEQSEKTMTSTVVSLFNRFGQYGIAASVAAIMVVSAIGLQSNNNTAQDIPVLQTIPTGGYASPVSLQSAITDNDMQQKLAQKERLVVERQMNAYLKDHILQQRLKASIELSDK